MYEDNSRNNIQIQFYQQISKYFQN